MCSGKAMTTYIQTQQRVLAITPTPEYTGVAVAQLDATIDVGSANGPPFSIDKLNWSIVKLGTIKNSITGLNTLPSQSKHYYAEVCDLLIKYRPDGLATENPNLIDGSAAAMAGILSVMPSATFTTTQGLIFPENKSTFATPHIDERVEFSPLYIPPENWRDSYSSMEFKSASTPIHLVDASLIAILSLREKVKNRFGLEVPHVGPRGFKSLLRNYYDNNSKKGATRAP